MRDRRKLRHTEAFIPLAKSLLKQKLRTGGRKCQNVELGRGACSGKMVRREVPSCSLLHQGWDRVPEEHCARVSFALPTTAAPGS